ncbi:MAG: S8 family serine peptidase [Halieaceae bacterium]|jgi:hypothetical protein|nr:S8 family serine peptidase [Halieaceae bacterium]
MSAFRHKNHSETHAQQATVDCRHLSGAILIGIAFSLLLLVVGQAVHAQSTPVGATIEQLIDQGITQEVEGGVEESVEESVAENIEDQVEEEVARTVEEKVAGSVSDIVEEDISQSLEDDIEDLVEGAVEDSVEKLVEASVEGTVEEAIEETLEQYVESEIEEGVQETIAVAVEDRLEGNIDNILEKIESGLEVDDQRIKKDQWLVMAEPGVFDKLAEEGYLFDTVTELPGIGLWLAEVAAPSSFDISQVRQGVIDVVGGDEADVDLNHIYTAGMPDAYTDQGIAPRAAVHFPKDTSHLPLRIGMIDSQVDVTHPALQESRIESRSFAPAGAVLPDFHGTAIASIIAANADDYKGLAPATELYAAAVFERDQQHGDIASTVSLVRALDWLVTGGVEVVNISLAGPPNRLLKTALDRAVERGVLILAAAGNGGPTARPMYPAAYPSVVALTAVDSRGKVYRLANRGAYVDLAAPGVGLLHARAGGGYTASSGTSFAVPFASTAAARLLRLEPDRDPLELLFQSAEDLGQPGRDEVYGHGLLRPEKPLVTSGVETELQL